MFLAKSLERAFAFLSCKYFPRLFVLPCPITENNARAIYVGREMNTVK